MSQQDHRIRRLAEHARDALWLARPEAQACQFQSFASHVEPRPRVLQYFDVVLLQGSRHFAVVIVVAENGKDAVWGLEGRQQFRDGTHERAIAERHVVATQDDEVRVLGHHQVHRDGYVAGWHRSTVVHVGQESDPQAVERPWQP